VGKDTGQRVGKESSGKEASSKRFYPIYGTILLIIAFIIYIVLQTPKEPIVMLRRFAGAFAYLTMFLVIISSEYMAKMRKISGMPFIKTHHNLARVGIRLIFIHPMTFVLEVGIIQIFTLVSPTNLFIALAGRPAFYLFILAAGITRYRKRYRNWRKVHYLSYLAFLLVSIHDLMIGEDFTLNIMKILALAMVAIVIVTFIDKRSGDQDKKKYKRELIS
jgi:methionine sulfoxide reductase heme-binding subunit